MRSSINTNFPVEILSDKTIGNLLNEISTRSVEEEPYFIADLSDIVCKYKKWKLLMPRIQPYYAVKCNDYPAILHLLAALGTGFDCASKCEIQDVLSIGVEPSRIIYANPCKTRSFIKHAESVGVDLMTFDNVMELRKIKMLHPNAKLVIRIRVDDSSAVCRLGLKFGCDLKDVPMLLETAKGLDLNVVGVSFHVGSGCQDASAYAKAVESAREVVDIADTIGYRMDLLDIGGGFPGCKGPFVTFEEIATVVNASLDKLFPPEMGIKIIAEPGRYFVASAFTLCTNVIAKRDVITNEGEQCCMYYVNDGVYGSFNCLLFDHAKVQPVPLLDANYNNRPVLKSSVWGPTCDSLDCIMDKCYLPVMEVGEWLFFENMGAYTVCAASTFNGFQKPNITCIFHIHILAYLQQLPSWTRLVEIFGPSIIDFPLPEYEEECKSLPSNEHCLLPRAESVSA